MSKWLKDESEVNEILNCRDEKGFIPTDDVVEKARDKKSPIHKYFEWDKTKAAYAFNQIQARNLIKRIPIEYVNKGAKRIGSMFYNVRILNEEKEEITHGYIDVRTLTKDQDFKRQAMREIVSEIRHWQDIYSMFEEIDRVINEPEVEKLEKEYA